MVHGMNVMTIMVTAMISLLTNMVEITIRLELTSYAIPAKMDVPA